MSTNNKLIALPMLCWLVLLLLLCSSLVMAADYTCPMHPHYISAEAGDCPICGMRLVAMTKSSPVEAASQNRKSVQISPEIIQQIGVRTEAAEMALFGTDIRSYGVVGENNRTRYALTGRVAGWIEELAIKAVGDEVKEGDLLFTLYSPDLVAALQDYRAAVQTNSQGRIRASQQRLKTLGVGSKALEIVQKQADLDRIPFFAEQSGVVSKVSVQQGDYVQPGSPVALIQQYDTVWMNVSVAEKDLQFINTKTNALVSFPNLGNLNVRVAVDYIHPVIDKASRTGSIRLVLDNKEGQLRPGAYADVVFESNVDLRLSVPTEAILKSTEGHFIILAEGEGRFQPQQVKPGIYNKGRTEILQGLEVGQAVVVSGQFLLDSESSLRETFRKLQRAKRPLSLLEVTPDQLAMIDHLVDAGLYLHESLVDEREIRAHKLEPALQLNQHLLPVFRGTLLQIVLEDAARALQQVNDSLTATERNAAISALVIALKPWIFEGQPAHYRQQGLKVFMDHTSGLHWMQLGKMAHPYGGSHGIQIEIPKSMKPKKTKSVKKSTISATSATSATGGAHAHH